MHSMKPYERSIISTRPALAIRRWRRATDDEAKLLEVPNGEPLFFMETEIKDDQDIPVHIGRQYIF
ncbi:hypothetical protein [Robertmurraya sp.]|uniref:hypothetical protein n=1 Tax=Robertmurraya sp. TaxID=2837525 RepID=UPI0037042439